jgi:Flp pilus assembly pilin Flp
MRDREQAASTRARSDAESDDGLLRQIETRRNICLEFVQSTVNERAFAMERIRGARRPSLALADGPEWHRDCTSFPTTTNATDTVAGIENQGERQMKLFETFVSDEQGASMAEYAMLLALIAVATIGAVSALRDQIVAVFNASASTLGNAK